MEAHGRRPGILDRVADGSLSPPQALELLAGREIGANARPLPGPARRPGGPDPEGPEGAERRDGDGLEQVMAELHALVGLEPVKRSLEAIGAYVEIQHKRRAVGLGCEPMVLHMAFKGNPGTGKTTVARLVGRMLKHMGALSRGHTVEVERADLVGEYVGHTAQRTREQIRKALGGVLFIDEAYSLARGGEKDFGKEAVDGLVKAMEDHRHDLVVIMAGYRQEMELFLRMNPGLRSRIPFILDFPDYSGEELLCIADRMLHARDYRLTPEARQRLGTVLWHCRLAELEHFGNARLVRNILEAAIRRQAVRLRGRPDLSREDLMLITESDIPLGTQPEMGPIGLWVSR